MPDRNQLLARRRLIERRLEAEAELLALDVHDQRDVSVEEQTRPPRWQRRQKQRSAVATRQSNRHHPVRVVLSDMPIKFEGKKHHARKCACGQMMIGVDEEKANRWLTNHLRQSRGAELLPELEV
jgi:hypothetical protein